MARLVILGINYAPESTGTAPYTTGLAEHLAAAGHEVTVVTGMPHYPSWRIAAGYRGRLTTRGERGGGHGVRRGPYAPPPPPPPGPPPPQDPLRPPLPGPHGPRRRPVGGRRG